MDDETAARALIQEIRRNKGVDEPGGFSELALDLENSTRLLSEDLYSTPTRFLLELLQNADDNVYENGRVLRVSIVYRSDGYLWVGSNEGGFLPENVKTICRIHASTKRVIGGRKGYIGEKGIGFKSVFKVANVVSVKSGALQFQFDRDQPLGMIAPRWCTFKHNEALDERTMFCLRIPEIADRDVLEKEVRGLEPELLLFLRQIRHINVTLQHASGKLDDEYHLERRDKSALPDSPGSVNDEQNPERGDDDQSELKMTDLSRSSSRNSESTREHFVVCQHTSKNMPEEGKRHGVTESDIMVAFPVDDSLTPQIRSRSVYNFLPIRGYGFPFVLQADFMLSANRESILRHNAWNKALVSSTADLIVGSVQSFNQTRQSLQYTWPRYLSLQGDLQDTAFAGFPEHLIRTLRNKSVLLSQSNTLERPLALTSVPTQLTDGEKPLLTGLQGMESFTHHAYSSEDLAVLGVRQQSQEDFLQLLSDLVRIRPNDFRQHTSKWHARLASAILFVGSDPVRGLKLILLRGGHWVASQGNKLFFPDDDEGTALPGGIEVDAVDDVAARDAARRALFIALGVSTLDEAKVSELILQQHGRKVLDRHSWSVEDIVEHAWFLFRAKTVALDGDSKLKQLLVAATDGKFRPGAQTYMDVPGASTPVSDILGSARTTVPFLHERYLSRPQHQPTQDPAGPGNLLKKWLVWLEKIAGVRVLPRLAATSGSISQEFDVVIKTGQANYWLNLLRNEPEVYSQELQAPGNGLMRNYLINSKVLCIDGKLRPLKDV